MKTKILAFIATACAALFALAAFATTTPANKTGFGISDVLSEVVHGTVTASKALIVDANKDLATLRNVTVSGNIVHGATTLAEADTAKIDGITAGTVTASKAIVADANGATLTLKTAALSLGTSGSETLVTATGAEINNALDVTAQLQAIVAADAVTVTGAVRRATLSGGAYAITLAVPDAAAIGAILVIEYTGGDTDAVTLALTNVIGESGGTTATFNADGEGMVFIGTTLGWVVLSEFGGVTLA